MTLERKVKLIEHLFYRLNEESVQFQKTSGLSCVAGCGKCCTFPDIEASPLEFFPWAFHLFMNGEADAMMHKLKTTHDNICVLYHPLSLNHCENGKGYCSIYQERGLICRLFGVAASKDKFGKLRLATCKIIKEGQAVAYSSTTQAIAKGLYVPVFTDYYMRLNQIDFHLGNIILPINEALMMALDEVSHYYNYHPLPRSA